MKDAVILGLLLDGLLTLRAWLCLPGWKLRRYFCPCFPVWLHLLDAAFFICLLTGRLRKVRIIMQTRVAIIGIIVENPGSVSRLNEILHEYGQYIIGRMGIPYREKGINIISIAIDAPQDVISSLAGKVGRLDGVQAKTAYSSILSDEASR